jgi:cobalt/nickel transport system permease protein
MNRPIPDFLLSSEPYPPNMFSGKLHRMPYIDRTLRKVLSFLKTGQMQNGLSHQKGFFQQLDTRVKVLFLILFPIMIGLTNGVCGQVLISSIILSFYLLSAIKTLRVYKRIGLITLMFGVLPIIPASLNIFTPGYVILPISHSIGITNHGANLLLKLTFKVMNSAAATLLVLHTTSFSEIVQGLRIFRIPAYFLLILTLAYKFIFVLSEIVLETYLALKLRLWSKTDTLHQGEMAANRMVYVFKKAYQRYEEAYLAMVARGFTGNVQLCYLKPFGRKDWMWSFFVVGLATLLLLLSNIKF